MSPEDGFGERIMVADRQMSPQVHQNMIGSTFFSYFHGCRDGAMIVLRKEMLNGGTKRGVNPLRFYA
ncbi:hypothetical protein HUG15_16450 [Salicibibacter cibarius]|uniref:Uncharacterized protein n=1 Tax=Salicibibacter cibarius TaxID=2743000 RepID=A0A7T6Z5C5_9BACI|nr:hypothetical protein [Salicibibacter cibarius]QQK77007.1 hypothetical protein HUG15_16450 [Salicibibacter cibarius]